VGQLRVLLCDDHPIVRDGLRLLLGELGMDVVGEAATGEEAVEAAAALQPDVVVMDLHLPGMSGVDATRVIKAEHPQVGVLVLTMLDDDAALLASLRAGANAYLLKGAAHADMERALNAVARGDVMVTADVAHRLRAGLQLGGEAAPFAGLSRRENEILQLLARGDGNEQIARSLMLSVKTVRNNVSSIFTKLGVTSRAAAVAAARDAGLGQPLASPHRPPRSPTS
jgi:DNA-binding NarL/FixJ family response regulator